MKIVILLVLMVCCGIGVCEDRQDIDKYYYLVGHEVSIMHLYVDEQNVPFSNADPFVRWDGMVTDVWYDFVQVTYKDNSIEWVNACYIVRINDK
jgi:hypothetical protein